MELKVTFEGVIIGAALLEIIYIWTQKLKRLLENAFFKWFLKLIGQEEWLKYVPILTSVITGFATCYLSFGKDGFTFWELLETLTLIFGANVQHYELRKLKEKVE